MPGSPARASGDGTLSVEDGRGKVTIQARGGVIGRLDRGTVTIYDLTPEDTNDPVVFGDDQPVVLSARPAPSTAGAGMRFRVIGGRYRIVIQGRGIDLSVVGKGFGSIKGDPGQLGVYSLDGADCRKDRAACKLLPEVEKRFLLEAPATERAGEARFAPRTTDDRRRPDDLGRRGRGFDRLVRRRSTSRTPATTCAPSRRAAPH